MLVESVMKLIGFHDVIDPLLRLRSQHSPKIANDPLKFLRDRYSIISFQSRVQYTVCHRTNSAVNFQYCLLCFIFPLLRTLVKNLCHCGILFWKK
eukprot:UN07019